MSWKNLNGKFQPSRRMLLGSGLVLAGLGVAACNGPSSGGTVRVVPVAGIQTYTLRAAMAEDFSGTIKAIAGMGYKDVEFHSYYDTDPAEVRRLIEGLGLKTTSSHFTARLLRDDPLPLVEAAAIVGHKYVTLGWLHPDDRQSIDDYKNWAEACNRVGEACKAVGLRFAYHNHDFELLELDGELPYDILMNETDPDLVDFELDFYWARKSGRSVMSVLEMDPKRFTMCHTKDMDSNGNMADVGEGEIDFAGIFTSSAGKHIKHFYAERDDAPDPIDSATKSRVALDGILDEVFERT